MSGYTNFLDTWRWHPQCRGALSQCHEVGVQQDFRHDSFKTWMEFVRQILMKLKTSSNECLLMKVFIHSLMWLQWSLCDHSSVHTNLMGLCASAVMRLTGGLHAMSVDVVIKNDELYTMSFYALITLDSQRSQTYLWNISVWLSHIHTETPIIENKFFVVMLTLNITF